MRYDKTQELRKKGYNCAQAVLCSFAEELNMDETDLFAISEAFGLGMGVMNVCGAVSAMSMVASLKSSDRNLESPKSKSQTYKLSKKFIEKFNNKNKSIICRDLKGLDTKVPLRSCEGCIKDAVDILEEYFKSL